MPKRCAIPAYIVTVCRDDSGPSLGRPSPGPRRPQATKSLHDSRRGYMENNNVASSQKIGPSGESANWPNSSPCLKNWALRGEAAQPSRALVL
jgi:hypothetical protein